LLVNKKPSGGSYPCHITINKNGYVLTSNYGDGAVGLLKVRSDGKFLYASNRGHNSIAIYQVGSKNGSLSMISTESTRGEIPRNFSITPDDKYLLVANKKTNSLVSFARDRKNGMLKFVDQIPVPTPVCILF
ncbi:MAG: beta-propeller fold lactonase family protein, partial [Cyclobacteriaceae bacterium]